VRERGAVEASLEIRRLGFWLKPTGAAVMLVGWDAGVSCFTTHDPARHLTYTVVCNTSDSAQPVSDRLDELLAG
jgi:hypothetical protein